MTLSDPPNQRNKWSTMISLTKWLCLQDVGVRTIPQGSFPCLAGDANKLPPTKVPEKAGCQFLSTIFLRRFLCNVLLAKQMLLLKRHLWYSMIIWNCQKVNSSYSALKPLPWLPKVPKVAYLWDILVFQAPVTFRYTGESHGSYLQLEYIGQHWRNLMKIHTLWLSSCLTSAWEWSGPLLGNIGNHFRYLRVFGSALWYTWGVKMWNGILRGSVLVHFLQFFSTVSSHK